MNIQDFKNKKFLPNSELNQLVDIIFSELSVCTIDSTLSKRQLGRVAKEWLQDNGLHQFADRWSLCLLIGGLLKLCLHARFEETRRQIANGEERRVVDIKLGEIS